MSRDVHNASSREDEALVAKNKAESIEHAIQRRMPSSVDSVLGPYVERKNMEKELLELRGVVDAMRHGHQRWEEITDNKSGNIYYRDSVTGQVGKQTCVFVGE